MTGLGALAILVSLTALQGSSSFSPDWQQLSTQTELLRSPKYAELELADYRLDYRPISTPLSYIVLRPSTLDFIQQRHTLLAKLQILEAPDLVMIHHTYPKVIPSSAEDDLLPFFLG